MPHPVVHFEIPAEDLERIRRFYVELFGWKIEAPPDMPDYLLVDTEAGEGINGGLIRKRSPQHTLINYVAVESVAEYADRLRHLGGTMVVPKTAVPRMGYFAVGLDPDHNLVGLWEENPTAA